MSKKKAMFFKQAVAEVIEVYPTGNAASIGAGELDNWSNNWSDLTADVASVQDLTEDNDGDYAILITNRDGGTFKDGRFSIADIAVGETYSYSFLAKRGVQGTTQYVNFRDAFTTKIVNITTNSWELYTGTLTGASNGAGGVRCLVSSNVGALGDELYIDGFSIIKI